MSEEPLALIVRGARGSAPSPGAQTLRYGGHTTCLELAFTSQHRLIVDCGSGLRALHAELDRYTGPTGLRFDVFLTHFHSDHLEGLRLFRPLYDPSCEFVFRGRSSAHATLRQAVQASMASPSFPVQLRDTAARKTFIELDADTVWIKDVQITSCDLAHPQGAVGYRLQRGRRSVAFMTDSEPGDERIERGKLDLARGVDVLIHDAQYTPDEYDEYRGWGHSNWRQAVDLARRAGAGRLVLFHHDPDRTDDELDRIVREVRQVFPNVEAAHEGLSFPL